VLCSFVIGPRDDYGFEGLETSLVRSKATGVCGHSRPSEISNFAWKCYRYVSVDEGKGMEERIFSL
jgi:hypothetical protein